MVTFQGYISQVLKPFYFFCENVLHNFALFLGASSNETIDLFQQYVDLTGDVQTVSWIVVLYMPKELANSREEPMGWISNYRNLLTCWSLCYQRSEFDNACNDSGPVKIPAQQVNNISYLFTMTRFHENIAFQVYASCNYCGKSIAKPNDATLNDKLTSKTKELNNVQELKKMAATFTSNAILKRTSRFQACTSCRKPLPRCAICLLYMGSHSGFLMGTTSTLPNERTKKGTKITPFSNFFTFCQTCRHGGHADHIDKWFDENSECPVTGCNCKCVSLDIDSSNAIPPSHYQDKHEDNNENNNQVA